mgnify:FL=1
MSEVKEVLEELKGIQHVMDEKVTLGIAPIRVEMDRLTAAMLKAETKLVELQREAQKAVSRDNRIRLQGGKLAGFDLLDLRILQKVMEARYSSRGEMPPLMQAIHEGRKELRNMITEEAIFDWEDRAIDQRSRSLSHVAPSTGVYGFRDAVKGWTGQLLAERTRALDSTTAAAGDELVPTFEAAELWLDVNLDTLILPLLPQQVMPTNPFDIPRQFGDTNWYPTDENVQATTTDPTTGKTTLTAYGLKTGIPFSDELEEDAIVALVSELRAGLARNAAQIIDDVLLNADTTTTDNINYLSTTISRTTAGRAHQLIGFDGLIHLPLVDNTSAVRNQNAAADIAMFVGVMGLIGKYWVARRRGEVVWVTDPRTMAACMGIATLLGMQNFGERATLSAGEIRVLLSIPVIRSDQMRAASAGGLVSNTASLNTTGRILLLNTTQWRVGFRRQITFEADREAGRGQTTLYVSFRMALSERTGTRSTATHTGLVRNITGI